MKYNKIIYLTISNGLVLLLFGSILASCQRNNLRINGHFTNYPLPNRAPSSLETPKNFDPKQIYIYCQVSSVQSKQCFKQYYNEILSELKKENQMISHKLEVNYLGIYHKSENDVQMILNDVIDKLEEKIVFFAGKQRQFCNENAKLNYKKCLENNIHANTMHILNHYQQLSPDLNGHEYLFLKSKIQSQLTKKLENQENTKTL